MQSFHFIAHTGEGLWSIDLLLNLLWKSSLLTILLLTVAKGSVARRTQGVWRMGLFGLLAIFLLCSYSLWEVQTYAPVSASIDDVVERQGSSLNNPIPEAVNIPSYHSLGSLKPSARFEAVLIGIWIMGFILIVGKVLLEYVLLRYAGLKAEVYDPLIQDVESIKLTQQVGLSTPPKILLSSSIPIPLTYGWSKPIILLPTQALNWEKERLLQVLLHELVHIQRNDYLFNIIAILVKALYWFNPLIHLLLKKFHLNREWACDEQVIQLGTNKYTYAENLLAIAAFRQNGQLALSFTRSHSLTTRIKRVLNSKAATPSPTKYKLLPWLALVLPSLVMLSTNLRTIADKPYSTKGYQQTIEGLTSMDDAQKIKSLHQLAQWGRRTSFQQVKPFALDPNTAVRMQALSTLQQIACLPAFCLISQQLQDQDQVIRQHADELLSAYPSSKLREYLRDYLKEPSMENWFIQYFSQIRDLGQTERLANHLSKGQTELQPQIQQQLLNPHQAGALAQLEQLLRN